MSDGSAEMRFAHALSLHRDSSAAAAHIVGELSATFQSPPDLIILNASGDHALGLGEIAAAVKKQTGAERVIGCSAAGVLAGAMELENRTAVTALAASLPGVQIVPLSPETLRSAAGEGVEQVRALLRAECGEAAAAQHAATLVFADPFSTPIASLLTALDAVPLNKWGEKPALFGGIASGSDVAGGNTLVLDDDSYFEGAVAFALLGRVKCDIAVSQGCRAIGPNFTVSRAKGNLLLELDGEPAVEVLRNVVHELGDEERKLMAGGLFLGRAIDDAKTHLGRGDYLIRNVVGADESSGGVAVADLIPEGATVRLHFRDATTATEDLELLLNAQQLYGAPAGAFLITCNGRGERFFGKQNHDSVAIQRAFLPTESGSEAAKSGEAISPLESPIPLAGFFAAGEIGPIADQAFLHGYTACLVCFRTLTDS